MSTLTHTIKFNNPVTFTDHTGVTFHNLTTLEDVANTGVASAAVSPSDIISYDVTWVTDPAVGDVIEWRYDGLGNYTDNSSVVLELHMAGDSHIDIPITPNRFNEGRLELEFKVDEISSTKAILDSQTSDRNLMLLQTADIARGRIFNSINIDHAGTIVAGTWHKIIYTWAGGDGNATNFDMDGVSLAGTQAAVGLGDIRLGNRDSLSIPMVGYIRNFKAYDSMVGGNLTVDYRIDDGSSNGGVIKNYADESGATDGVLTLGASSAWEGSGSVSMDAQSVTLVNCKGTYTASIYQGIKTTDTTVRTEALASGVTKVLVDSNAGTGTVTVLNNGVSIGTVADGDAAAFDVVAGNISWSSINVGTIGLGQGKP